MFYYVAKFSFCSSLLDPFACAPLTSPWYHGASGKGVGPEFLKGLPPSLMSRSCLCYIHSLKLTASPSCPFHPSSTEVISYCLVMWRLHLGFVVESRQGELFCWNDSKPTHEPGHIFSYCASTGECPASCFSCSSPFGTSRLESCLPYDSRVFLSQGAPTAIIPFLFDFVTPNSLFVLI